MPKGAAWRKNPIPLIVGQDGLPVHPGAVAGKTPAFAPPCTNHSMCTGMGDGDVHFFTGGLEIVDTLQIPADLPAGHYGKKPTSCSSGHA